MFTVRLKWFLLLCITSSSSIFSLFIIAGSTVADMAQPNSIAENLMLVQKKVEEAAKNRPDHLQYVSHRLVAVSKTKPIDLIIEAYNLGQRHFGENYPQELIAKANDEQILEDCQDIKWHFIGHLQSNKASKIVSLPNLYMVETVDSMKIATILNRELPKYKPNGTLFVYVQINTSSEDEKSGVPPNEAANLIKFIIENCPNLKFRGLMTIGKYGYDTSKGPNPDFLSLAKCKEELCTELNLKLSEVELSMGMSNDYEQAIELGSSSVRVGSSIFGERELKTKS